MIDTSRTYLPLGVLTMDLQPAATSFLADPSPVLTAASRAMNLARQAHAAVASVRMAFDHDELTSVPPTSPLAPSVAVAGRALLSDSPATAVHPEVAPVAGDITIRKTRVGAFHASGLDQRLRERGVTTVLLSGVMTSGVVLTTVREAADRDYRILVLAEGCADPDADVHRFLLENIFPRQARVVGLDDLTTILGGIAAGTY